MIVKDGIPLKGCHFNGDKMSLPSLRDSLQEGNWKYLKSEMILLENNPILFPLKAN